MMYPKTATTADKKINVPCTTKPISEALAPTLDMFEDVTIEYPRILEWKEACAVGKCRALVLAVASVRC